MHLPSLSLGHTLGTSLFSPPPSTSSHPALFGQTSSAKAQGDPPTHPPIGTRKNLNEHYGDFKT